MVTTTSPALQNMQRYFQDIQSFRVLRPEEEVAVAKQIEAGDEEAVETMIKANLRLVISVAKHYANWGVPIEDLVAEGNIGLHTAVHRFDHRVGAKFSTYAVWWIKQSIRKALTGNAHIIRLPSHVMERTRKIEKARTKLTLLLDRPPTNEEIAAEAECSVAHVLNEPNVVFHYVSLDQPTDVEAAEGDTTISDSIADENCASADDQMADMEIRTIVREAMVVLNDREKVIISMRFGFDGMDESTLDAIGKKFNLTRERIRQIEFKAMKKMRTFLERKKKFSDSTGISEGGLPISMLRHTPAAE